MTRQSLKQIQHKISIKNCGTQTAHIEVDVVLEVVLDRIVLVSETQFHQGMFSGTRVFNTFPFLFPRVGMFGQVTAALVQHS